MPVATRSAVAGGLAALLLCGLGRADPGEGAASSTAGEAPQRPNEVALSVGGGASTLADGEVDGALRYARAFGPWAVSLGAGGGAGAQHTAANDVSIAWIGVEATVERRWRLGAPTLAIALGAEADLSCGRP